MTPAEIVSQFEPTTHPGIVADAMQDEGLDADAALMREWGAWLKPKDWWADEPGLRDYSIQFFCRPDIHGTSISDVGAMWMNSRGGRYLTPHNTARAALSHHDTTKELVRLGIIATIPEQA